jgi:hypothetical protein
MNWLTYFNIILLSLPRSRIWSHPCRLTDSNSICLSQHPCTGIWVIRHEDVLLSVGKAPLSGANWNIHNVVSKPMKMGVQFGTVILPLMARRWARTDVVAISRLARIQGLHIAKAEMSTAFLDWWISWFCFAIPIKWSSTSFYSS